MLKSTSRLTYSKYILTVLIAFQSGLFYAQDCQVNLSGKVLDEGTQQPLSFVSVVIQETGSAATTDDEGAFSFDPICPGHYHLIISHIGCEPEFFHLTIERDSFLELSLAHTPISTGAITISGQSNTGDYQSKSSVNKLEISDNLQKSFSDLLENQTGVALLRSGTGVAKPIVHGLYGNRLTIINNGIAQGGQQWGNDHSPEIDPSAAKRITVVKGTHSLEYQGGSLGSVILVEPERIGTDPHLHGTIGYAYETNGKGHNTYLQLRKYTPNIAWRFSGTIKRFGDRQTPDYFLTNTGTGEANASLQLERTWKEKWFAELYLSTFNKELGILRGSHIGNETDLIAALNNAVPYFTQSTFSYQIEAPRQSVQHHLAKLKLSYSASESQLLTFTLAGQLNNRKEFDVRRGGRSNIPAMSLRKYTYTGDVIYQRELNNQWQLKLGNQFQLSDNTNIPETDILPLIPDHYQWSNGLYIVTNKKWNTTSVQLGGRYDLIAQNVVAISAEFPREILRYNNLFHNVTAGVGVRQDFAGNHVLRLNLGSASRSPAVNELYSNGLHQGVSGIELGDPNLKPERSIKGALEYQGQLHPDFSLETQLYYQRFQDYIMLTPQDEIRLTIRGAFPVFMYEQADVDLFGWDVSTQFTVYKSLFGKLSYSYIQGDNRDTDEALINVPGGRVQGTLVQRIEKSINISKIAIKDFELALDHKYVFKQDRVADHQDYVSAPEAYHITGVKVSANLIFPQYKLRMIAKSENLFDNTYRSYLNRHRYFADEMGRTVVLGVNIEF